MSIWSFCNVIVEYKRWLTGSSPLQKGSIPPSTSLTGTCDYVFSAIFSGIPKPNPLMAPVTKEKKSRGKMVWFR